MQMAEDVTWGVHLGVLAGSMQPGQLPSAALAAAAVLLNAKPILTAHALEATPLYLLEGLLPGSGPMSAGAPALLCCFLLLMHERLP